MYKELFLSKMIRRQNCCSVQLSFFVKRFPINKTVDLSNLHDNLQLELHQLHQQKDVGYGFTTV